MLPPEQYTDGVSSSQDRQTDRQTAFTCLPGAMVAILECLPTAAPTSTYRPSTIVHLTDWQVEPLYPCTLASDHTDQSGIWTDTPGGGRRTADAFYITSDYIQENQDVAMRLNVFTAFHSRYGDASALQ